MISNQAFQFLFNEQEIQKRFEKITIFKVFSTEVIRYLFEQKYYT